MKILTEFNSNKNKEMHKVKQNNDTEGCCSDGNSVSDRYKT